MSSDANHIDTAMLDQLRELLGERFSELVERFVEDGGKRVTRLRDALPTQDFSVIHAEAHGLKGSSRNIGANPLGELCAELEDKGRNAEGAGIEPLFAAIEQEFAAVTQRLQSRLP